MLQPAAVRRRSPTGNSTSFNDSGQRPQPSIAINNLTVTVDLTDQESVQNLSLILVAPNGDQITLVENQINAAGTANTGQGLPSGNAIGWSVSPRAPPVTPGSTSGRSSTTTPPGTSSTRRPRGPMEIRATDYIGYFRPEGGQPERVSIADRLGTATSTAPGRWRSRITPPRSPRLSATGQVKNFSLQFSTGMTAEYAKSHRHDPGHRRARQYLPLKPPSSPNAGVGPGLVLAIDNTLGSDSPYQGRIYAAYVGYDNVTDSTGSRIPTTNTDIFLAYSDNGGRTWSTPVEVNDDDATGRRLLRARANRTPMTRLHRPDAVPAGDRGRPGDGDPGPLVARRPRRRRQRPGRHLHHHQHRRRQYLQRPDLRQPAGDRDRRDHGPDRCPRPAGR